MLNIFGKPAANETSLMPGIVVDTSVIIDGRIGDIARAGFMPGRLVIPRFVLAELQNIADSSDSMRRSRGRRGLEVLSALQGGEDVDVEVVDQDFEDIKEVDAKLVRLAKTLGMRILTTDYNLNRVAQIEGVRVLNVNELSNAVRPVVVPGEMMMVKVVQPGKEKGQGVGYLPDGTMIVVDKGDKLIGQDVQTEITRVFQTVAGKMLFAAPVGSNLKPPAQPSTDQVPSPPAPDSATSPARSNQPRRNNRNNNNRHNRGDRSGDRSQSAAPARPASNSRRTSPTQRLENSLLELTSETPDHS